MTGNKTTNLSEAIRNLIACDTQFGWNGETTLKLPELLDLQARGWLIEGDENNEFSLTVGGEAVVARALQLAAPAELADQQGDALAGLAEACEDMRAAAEECDNGEGLAHAVPFHQWNEFLSKLDSAVQALAARQPVAQEPVGYIDPADMARVERNRNDPGVCAVRVHLRITDEDMPDGSVPVYAAPPAQGIDLGQLPLYRMASGPGGVRNLYKDDTGSWVKIQDVERLIDQRVAAPGESNG